MLRVSACFLLNEIYIWHSIKFMSNCITTIASLFYYLFFKRYYYILKRQTLNQVMYEECLNMNATRTLHCSVLRTKKKKQEKDGYWVRYTC